MLQLRETSNVGPFQWELIDATAQCTAWEHLSQLLHRGSPLPLSGYTLMCSFPTPHRHLCSAEFQLKDCLGNIVLSFPGSVLGEGSLERKINLEPLVDVESPSNYSPVLPLPCQLPKRKVTVNVLLPHLPFTLEATAPLLLP